MTKPSHISWFLLLQISFFFQGLIMSLAGFAFIWCCFAMSKVSFTFTCSTSQQKEPVLGFLKSRKLQGHLWMIFAKSLQLCKYLSTKMDCSAHFLRCSNITTQCLKPRILYKWEATHLEFCYFTILILSSLQSQLCNEHYSSLNK